MTQDARPFFTLDRGTVSTAAALIAPVGGRHRLLAAATMPRGADAVGLLEDLAWRVARTDPELTRVAGDPREWPRLSVHSSPPPRACLVAASAGTGRDLERAFSGAGWLIGGRFYDARPDPIALGEACLDPATDAVVTALSDDADEEERDRIRHTWPLVGSIGSMRDDLAVIACGAFSHRPEGIPDDRLFALPAPEPAPRTSETRLRLAARQLAAHIRGDASIDGSTDPRQGLRASIASLAVLLDARVEGLEIGAAAGSRSLAHPDREVRHMVSAEGALLPAAVLEDAVAATSILRWSSVAAETAGMVDRLRGLELHPWGPRDREAVALTIGALRAALVRLVQAWEPLAPEAREEEDAADVVVLSGGVFSALPPAAVALALADGIRRPGAATILHDHARVLGPIGALSDEGDRRRLIAELMDDCLLPIGSALMTGSLEVDPGGHASIGITTVLGADELHLEPDSVRLVDLPPGIVARLEIDPGQGAVLGVRGRHLTLEVSGGLGGLLVDTRPIVLDLPGTGERRRAALEGWERSLWPEAAR